MAKYTINFAPLTIDGEAGAVIGRQPYEQERLAELRRDFSETHVFQRDDETIIDVPVAPDQDPLGDVREEVDLARYRRLWPALFSAALVRAFYGARDILSHRPVSVVGNASSGLIRHRNLPEWLQRRTLLRFE